MLNFVPKTHPSVSLLYGKRAVQRIAVGAQERHIEIPTTVTDEISNALETHTGYLGNKFHSLPWHKYTTIKVDASNLIESNVKSALTNLDIYKSLEALYSGEKALVEKSVAATMTIPAIKIPISP